MLVPKSTLTTQFSLFIALFDFIPNLEYRRSMVETQEWHVYNAHDIETYPTDGRTVEVEYPNGFKAKAIFQNTFNQPSLSFLEIGTKTVRPGDPKRWRYLTQL